MTTFSKLYLNPQKRGASKLLSNPQAMHAAVRAAFPPDISESDARVLWRVDHREHEHILYIVGPEKPDATHLVEQAGWDTRPAQSVDYSRFVEQLMRGQQWAFELVANPVQSVAVPGKSRGKVVPHVTAAQQLQWLLTRGESAGFKVCEDDEGLPQVQVVQRTDLQFRKGEKGTSVSLRTARFRGQLEVVDADKLRHTLQHGLGRAKAYGCGLLTLAPI